MSRPLEQLLQASLQAQPPAHLDALVTERVLAVAQAEAAVSAARARRARTALALVLQLRRAWLRALELIRQLLDGRRADTAALTRP